MEIHCLLDFKSPNFVVTEKRTLRCPVDLPRRLDLIITI